MGASFSDTKQVRKGEELDRERLTNFIKNELPGVATGELEIEQFHAGHSNLTYLLRIGTWEAVLRRPPLGPVAKKAHDMEREFTILTGLHPHFAAAPKPIIFSADESIVGSPFFIMERRKGIVLDTDFPDAVSYDPSLGKRISGLMAEKLAALHEIDFTKTDLVNIAKPVGFMERQVIGWIKRYERAKTDDVPYIGLLTKWLERNMPSSGQQAIIHYDYKLNNAMFSHDFSKMTGLFDWEMTTVGDPLADVGAAMSYWIQKDDPDLLKKGLGKPPVTVMEGFYTRDEFLEAYAVQSGRDLSHIDYYITFAYFKLAVICQQIYFRYKKGQTGDQRFAHFNHFAENLIAHAAGTVRNL
ncbi:phosphotransferase family protein [Oceanobacillus sp. FSL H7-0719]|uniref:phosphotransferase family protein n=1 Tax=Oceanobacillus sp. FSL H7-0719 TaxID=2954507 RepID=UPI0032543906